MSLSFCENLGIFGALFFMLWIFVQTYQILPLLLVDVDW
jgi:hypothetical protein